MRLLAFTFVAAFAGTASLLAQQPQQRYMQYVSSPGCDVSRYDCQPRCEAPPPSAPPSAHRLLRSASTERRARGPIEFS
jgi:hypothetical protein